MVTLLSQTLVLVFIREITCHGMLINPPNRSSLWRFDKTYPVNFNDNEITCGGIDARINQNQGKCGVCGDNYAMFHPRPNENTGYYGLGKIVANYTTEQTIETTVHLTANILGNFSFSLCKLNIDSDIEPGEHCFRSLTFEDGGYKYPIQYNYMQVTNKLKLPQGFTCRHCVLRWEYVGGSNWGYCEDGSFDMGCGPQEMLRNCADIRILPK